MIVEIGDFCMSKVLRIDGRDFDVLPSEKCISIICAILEKYPCHTKEVWEIVFDYQQLEDDCPVLDTTQMVLNIKKYAIEDRHIIEELLKDLFGKIGLVSERDESVCEQCGNWDSYIKKEIDVLIG